MNTKVIIIQRFYYNFREGFFNYLNDISFDYKLINVSISRGRVKVHSESKNKSFFIKIFYFFLGENYVVFPFLFFKLIKLKPQIIVTEGGQNTINNLHVLLYCILFKKKYIVWDLGKGYANFKTNLLRNIYMKIYKYILKNSHYIFGYNSESYRYFSSLGIDNKKIIILNNTIDTRKIIEINKKSTPSVPKELIHLSKEGYTFYIFVGSLLRSKNIESLADLSKMLGKEYYLIIVGDGDSIYKEELKRLFNNTNSIFVGYKTLDQLKPYYELSMFSILPGLGGLSINQSMAFGVPVLCNSADGAEKDLIINNITGYVYDDLSNVYKYIVSKHKNDWAEMGKNAKDFLLQNHSVESMMNKFIYYINN